MCVTYLWEIIVSLTDFRYRNEGANRLNEEYQRLVKGLKDAQMQRETDMVLANPILPSDVLTGIGLNF